MHIDMAFMSSKMAKERHYWPQKRNNSKSLLWMHNVRFAPLGMDKTLYMLGENHNCCETKSPHPVWKLLASCTQPQALQVLGDVEAAHLKTSK